MVLASSEALILMDLSSPPPKSLGMRQAKGVGSVEKKQTRMTIPVQNERYKVSQHLKK